MKNMPVFTLLDVLGNNISNGSNLISYGSKVIFYGSKIIFYGSKGIFYSHKGIFYGSKVIFYIMCSLIRRTLLRVAAISIQGLKIVFHKELKITIQTELMVVGVPIQLELPLG